MTGCSVFVPNGSEPQGALGVLSRAKKVHSCKMISECIADVEKVGLKAYRYFLAPSPAPPVVVVWTSQWSGSGRKIGACRRGRTGARRAGHRASCCCRGSPKGRWRRMVLGSASWI